MFVLRREFLIAFGLLALRASVLGYGQDGHEIVGAIADERIKNTPAGKKIYALTDGITLRKAAFMPDEIKAWDKNGVDDTSAFPHYSDHPKIDSQLRDFWRANPPTQDPNSAVPSHHWFHYTDVPILNGHKYSDGKTGRTQWDVVHMISYCVGVLRGEVPENNPRKITKPVAVILLAHYLGDIHQPLHVGAEYFNHAGQAVDPDKGEAGVEDEGGNTLMLRLFHGRPEMTEKRGGLKLHGFWDNESVMANFPAVPLGVSRDERYQLVEPAKRNFVDQLAKEEPANWRAPANMALKDYPEFWANEILPIAKEAHERLQFVNVHQTLDQQKTVMMGDAREKNTADNVSYADWSAKVVRDELHKAGWRLADVLTKAIESTPAASSPAASSPEPIVAPAGKGEEHPTETAPTGAEAPQSPSAESDFGPYPSNYKEIVLTWMKKYGLDSSRVEWQTEPKPAQRPNPAGEIFSGYLVNFSTPNGSELKSRSVLIREGVIVSNAGFEK